MDEFHFLRPHMLWALLAVAAAVVVALRSRHSNRSWAAVCDAQLLPFLLAGHQEEKHHRLLPWVIGITGTLLTIALAGPTWERLPQPVFRDQSALVIALDLSRSMDAADIKPTRLTRAKHKITDILKTRTDGQTALLVYAGDSFTVAPLTDDVDTLLALLPSLETGMMPAQGSHAERAIKAATELLQQAGTPNGRILLVTDGVDSQAAIASLTQALAAGHRLSVLGIGTAEGAPIPDTDGGFVKNRKGDIVIPKLDSAALRGLAQRGAGRYAQLRSDDADIRYLLADARDTGMDHAEQASGLQTDQWREQGPWLILLAMPLVALAFRRGVLVLLIACILPLPQPAQALDWNSLWQRPDQRGMQSLQTGKPEQAMQQFQDPQWKATAQYRAGAYNQAAATLENIETPGALYNRGNALARLGQFPQAMQSYERALELDPQHEDARHNLELLKQQQQNQPQQSRNSKDQDQQQQEQEQSEQQGDSAGEQSQPQAGDSDTTENNDAQGEQQQAGQNDPADAQNAQQGERQSEPQQDEAQQDNESSQQQQQANTEQAPAEQQSAQEMNAMTDSDQQRARQEEASANEQWLRRIPDDPGGLLRRKFLYQYQRRAEHSAQEQQPW